MNGDVSFNAVDVNSIPSALVDHVEVVTGGASAIYGSDAVSGVVNIIMKKRFEGVIANAQIGSYKDFGAKYSADLTIGKTFLDDRLNVTATGFYNRAHNFINQTLMFGSTSQFRNIGDARVAGAELEAAAQIPAINSSFEA